MPLHNAAGHPEQRLSLASNGNVIVGLKTPYDDGITGTRSPTSYRLTAWTRRLHRTQRLKRVFAIEIEKCEKCGGSLRIVASIEDPNVIEKILKHLGPDQAPSARIAKSAACCSHYNQPGSTNATSNSRHRSLDRRGIH